MNEIMDYLMQETTTTVAIFNVATYLFFVGMGMLIGRIWWKGKK